MRNVLVKAHGISVHQQKDEAQFAFLHDVFVLGFVRSQLRFQSHRWTVVVILIQRIPAALLL